MEVCILCEMNERIYTQYRSKIWKQLSYNSTNCFN